MKIRKNDNVLVIAGKDRGKKGKVRFAYPKSERIMVEGANFIKKHTKPVKQVKQAGIVEREAPLHVSDVMLLCPKCSKPARIGYKILQDGKKVRACRVCGEVID
jgi:large subunit ribosomal protein L24